ncbi:MAG: TonB-dependent receptor [Chitinophagaceae bacterium]|nr:MAG: TonB-dependent receptor [Chitinophagaceae bacterium]
MRYILVLVTLALGLTLHAQSGTLIGQVKTNDGKPAEFVNITLKGKNRGSVADKDGRYAIRNLPAGTYTAEASFAGLKTQQQTVTLTENASVTIDFTLEENASELQQVIVSSTMRKYNDVKTDQTLRITTPLLELPQNVQIVSKEMLKDQQVTSMSDGLIRNVSGLTRVEHWADLYTNITARGTQIQALRNGFNVVASYWGPLTEDMSFVDHIEFVKGPAGFMLSSGNPGGMYNVVTKKPTGQTKGELSLMGGSFDLYRTSLDLDGKLSKDGRLLYRLNLAAQNKNSFRPNEFNDRYVVAPVISYQLDEKTKVTLEYTYQRANMSNVGSYYVFSPNGYAELPREFTTMPAGLEPTKINDHSVFATLNHDINSDWKFTAQVSRFDYNGAGASAWPSAVNADYTMIRNVAIWDAKSRMTMGQAFVTGNLKTGSVQHRLLGGLDAANKHYIADWGQAHDLDTAGGEFDLLNPNLGAPNNGYPRFDTDTPLEERAQLQGGIIDQSYVSGYVQDELGFLNNKIRLTLAGRFTQFAQSYNSPDVTANKWTPRIGLSVSVDKSTSVYGLYDQAFTPQTGILSNGGRVRPITGNNMEIGIKKELFNGQWGTSLTAYRIMTENEQTADPNSPPTQNLSIELGKKRAQGIEFDLHGTLARGLNLVLNYAYTEAKVVEVAQGVTVAKEGDIVPGYATHTANAWLSYRLASGVLRGLGINAGATFLGDRKTYWELAVANPQELEDYFKVDAGIFWDRDKIRVGLNVFNVFDKYLYSGSYYSWLSSYYTQAEPPRNLRLSVAYKF